MLEFLEFSSLVYMLGFQKFRISRYQDKWKVEFEKGMPGSTKDMRIFDNLDDWLERFEKLNVKEWKEEYHNYSVLDGESWTLKYDYAKEPQREINGMNAYPPNFNKFVSLMKELVEQL